MGNICISSDKEYYKLKKNNKVFKKCYKCKDRFCVDKGGFSNRRSCRCHNILKNYCTDCNISKITIDACNVRTCYHVISPKEKSFCIIC